MELLNTSNDLNAEHVERAYSFLCLLETRLRFYLRNPFASSSKVDMRKDCSRGRVSMGNNECRGWASQALASPPLVFPDNVLWDSVADMRLGASGRVNRERAGIHIFVSSSKVVSYLSPREVGGSSRDGEAGSQSAGNSF